MKKLSIVILSLSLIVFLASCNTEEATNNDDKVVDEQVTDDPGYIYMTLEELSEFDGKDGKEAYIAVDGMIYDVTDSNFWSDGSHNNFQAGQDLTEEIKNLSPHGVSNLDRVPLIGVIVEEGQ